MDGARAAAAALRRPPTAARERYPEWVPVRTERRKPRRGGAGTKVDADGMREYAILQCVHGCGAELAMLSDGKQKIQVIEDHLAECARIDAADRPAKKARGGVSVKTLADPAKAALVPMLHAKCQQDLATVRAEDPGGGTAQLRLQCYGHVADDKRPAAAGIPTGWCSAGGFPAMEKKNIFCLTFF